MALTRSCALIAAKAAAGEWADLRPLDDQHRAVTAAFIRQLLLSHPIAKAEHEYIRQQQPEYALIVQSGDYAPVPVASAGVRVRGAIVHGILDLADCCGTGGHGLPALALEDCHLLGESEPSKPLEHVDYLLGLDLSRSRLARLSLKGSRFAHVRAQETIIDGGVDISGVQPLDGWTARPWPGRKMQDIRDTKAAYPWPDAADAGKDLPIESRPTQGLCWVGLTASQIGGDLNAVGAKLRTPTLRTTDSYHPIETRYGLGLDRAVIGGSLSAIGESVFDGGLNLHLADIRGEVWLGGAQLVKGEGSALEGQGATLGGLFAASKDRALETFGGIYLVSARIKGHVVLKGARLDGHGASTLHAKGATIEGDLSLSGDEETGYFTAFGPVRLSGSSIGGMLDMQGAVLYGNETEALDASFLNIGSSARLRDVQAKGCIWLYSTNIGDALDLNGARLCGSVPNDALPGSAPEQGGPTLTAISGTDLTVGDSVWLGRGFTAAGSVRFQRAGIEKDIGIVGANIGAKDPDADAVDLGFSTISGTLSFKTNKFLGKVRLTHTRANILSDYNDGYDESEIELGGFEYQSLENCDLSAQNGNDDHMSCAKSRIEWLGRMGSNYDPQPYAHLARVLASQGRPEEAREILIKKYDKELERRRRTISSSGPLTAIRHVLVYCASLLFGCMFGYGLKPIRAMATIFVWILVGSCVIFVANYRGAMIVDQLAIAGSVQDGQMGAAETKTRVRNNMRCDGAIRSSLYALDVFIPLVDLRQESKCEFGVADGVKTLFKGIEIFGQFRLGSEVEIYRFFKVFYALIGWVIVSLSILTFSGVLQRRAEK